MALQSSIIETRQHFAGELVCSSAYWRIEQIIGNKQGLTFIVNAYVTGQGPMLYGERFSFVPELDGSNFIKQAYEHLKTLPRFADATNC
jgi:hypothetical protein